MTTILSTLVKYAVRSPRPSRTYTRRVSRSYSVSTKATNADAIRDAGGRRLTAVVPYFGYGGQDERFLDGEAVSPKTPAKHIAVDCDELLTATIHNPDIHLEGLEVDFAPPFEETKELETHLKTLKE